MRLETLPVFSFDVHPSFGLELLRVWEDIRVHVHEPVAHTDLGLAITAIRYEINKAGNRKREIVPQLERRTSQPWHPPE
jgi:hypothetical protein